MYVNTNSPQIAAFIGTANRKTTASERGLGTKLLLSEDCDGEKFIMHAEPTKEKRPRNEKNRSG